ncbi:hypothetical protein BDV10DRAFT_181921 [Aspergillus recurvatus]
MNRRTMTLFPLLAVEIPCRTHACTRRVYTIAQKVRIKETMRGVLDQLDEIDRRMVLTIKEKLEETFGFAGAMLENHVIGFLEFEYNEGSEGAWEAYTAKLLLDSVYRAAGSSLL